MDNYITKTTDYREEDLKLDIYYCLRKLGVYCQTEVSAVIENRRRRLDLVVYNRFLKPVLIIEVKNRKEVSEKQRNTYLKLGIPYIEIKSRANCKKLTTSARKVSKLSKYFRKIGIKEIDSIFIVTRTQEQRLPLVERVLNKEIMLWKLGKSRTLK